METALVKAEFEKKFLNLMYQTDVVITAPNIAYHLGIPIEEAEEHMLSLELNGVIQQETDDEGNSHYVMPNRPEPGSMPLPAGQQLPAHAGGAGGPPGYSYNPADLPPAPIYSKPGAPAKNVNGMVLNVILPGVGSLVCGKKIGAAMLGVAVLGVLVMLMADGWGTKAFGLLPLAGGWIWSIVAGVKLLSEK